MGAGWAAGTRWVGVGWAAGTRVHGWWKGRGEGEFWGHSQGPRQQHPAPSVPPYMSLAPSTHPPAGLGLPRVLLTTAMGSTTTTDPL